MLISEFATRLKNELRRNNINVKILFERDTVDGDYTIVILKDATVEFMTAFTMNKEINHIYNINGACSFYQMAEIVHIVSNILKENIND